MKDNIHNVKWTKVDKTEQPLWFWVQNIHMMLEENA